jgi:RimJ/RimL family protein N-acetyltransferase
MTDNTAELADTIAAVADFDAAVTSRSAQASDAPEEAIRIAVLTSDQVPELHQMRLDMTATLPRAFGPSNEQLKQLPLSHSQQCFQNHWGAGDNFLLAAWHGKQLIGTIGLLRCEEGNARHIAVVWNVFVRPSHQGRGVARSLLQGVIDKAREIPELEQLKLELSASEAPAFNLYKSLGFSEFGRESAGLKLSDDYIDVIHMSMAL